MNNKHNNFIWFPNQKDRKSILPNGKKAWIRIAEASVASLIIIGFVIVILSRQQVPAVNTAQKISEKQNEILDFISQNESLRNSVLINDKTALENATKKIIPNSWGFAFGICDINEICSTDIPYDKEVYSSEIIISSTLVKYEPKKLKFFVWMK